MTREPLRNVVFETGVIVLTWVVAAVLGFVVVALFVRAVLWVIR